MTMTFKSIRSSLPAHGRPQCGDAALAAAVLAVLFAGNVWADEYLDPIGGNGGDQFSERCAGGEILSGFEVRAADDVDAIRPLCVTARSTNDIGSPSPSNWNGGPGGSVANVVCPRGQPIVTGLLIGAEGPQIRVVNNILLYCGEAVGNQVAAAHPAAFFNAPDYDNGSHGRFSQLYDGTTQRCPRGQVAVGVHGRSGALLDAMGLICDAPPLVGPAKTIGRVKPGAPSPPHPPGWTICDAARDARSRNSPAAPNLEAQCKALKLSPTTTAKSTGTAGASVSPSATTTPPAPPQSDNGTGHPSKAETRDAMFRALAESIASMRDQPHSRPADDADGVPATIPGERVIGNRQDRYPVDSRPGRRQTTQASRGLTVQDLTQPENSIRIKVRYPTAYGYKEATGGLERDPNSCMAFYVSVLPASSTRPRELIRVDTLPHMRSSSGLYTCEYQMQDLPLDQPLLVRVMMSDERAAGSAVWVGGSQAQPPAGQRRTVLDGQRQVTLSADQPRASLSFEMVYSGGVP